MLRTLILALAPIAALSFVVADVDNASAQTRTYRNPSGKTPVGSYRYPTIGRVPAGANANGNNGPGQQGIDPATGGVLQGPTSYSRTYRYPRGGAAARAQSSYRFPGAPSGPKPTSGSYRAPSGRVRIGNGLSGSYRYPTRQVRR